MICNIVRLANSRQRRLWVADLVSISEFGVWPGVLQVGDVFDVLAMHDLGVEYLSTRSRPMLSYVGEGASHTLTAKPGDYLTVGEEELRLAGITPTLRRDGLWDMAPQFSSTGQDAQVRRDLVVEALISRHGGGSGRAQVVEPGRSQIRTGKVDIKGTYSWSWQEFAELDKRPWQPWPVEEFYRLIGFRVVCDYFELDEDGSVGPKFTTGQSSFTFSLNGVRYPLAWLVVGENAGEAYLEGWSHDLLRPGDRVRPWLLQNGGHRNGTLEFLYGDPV